MSGRIAAAIFLSTLCAAQTLRLRYGGPSSLYHVRNVSADTPAVVTVWRHTTGKQEHDLSDGDVVYLQFVPGCREANGYRRVVNSNRAAGTFAIADLNNNPITCSYPFDPTYESGLAGKVGTYTLRSDRPRIFLPGSGDLLTRSKDPDGSGPQVAPVATENDIPWQRIISTYAPYITPGCDGSTRELCPNEETVLDKGDASGIQGWAAVAAAYAWFADNSKTGYLNLARYLINNVERAMITNTAGLRTGLGFPCDITTDGCGWGSGTDWASIGMFNFALAYDLIRDQLSAAERQAFAQKMLNGWGGEHDCQNQLQKQQGSASLTQGSHTVTGSGFSVYSPGDGVYFKTTMKWGSTGSWGYVVSVQSDSEMYVNFISGSSKTAGAPTTVSGVDHYRVLPWDSTKCGAAFLCSGQQYNVGAVVRRAVSTLASAVDASATTITLVNAGSFPEQAPFYVVCESEVMLVLERQGNQFTVQRGQMYSTAAAHGAGKPVVWSSQLQGGAGSTTGPAAYLGMGWEHNLTAQKAVGYLLTAFALAGDDPRAAAYAEQIWNWYYDAQYIMNNKEYWSGPTQGGLQNQGYQWGRWQGTHWRVGLVGRNAFQEGPIEVMDDYFWRGLRTVYLWTPPSVWNRMPYETTIGDPYSNVSLGWTAMAATLWPGEEAARATFWYRNLSGLMDSLTGKTAAWHAAYAPPSAPQIDPRQTVNPWSFHDETDFNPSAYHGLLVSKKDWSDTAGMLIAGAGYSWPRDHDIDQGMYLPGGYSIFKGRKLLFGWDNSYGTGGSGSNWLSLANGASSLKTVNYAPWFSGSQGGQVNQIDRKHGDSNYVYARGNFTQSWKSDAAVLRDHRHFLHIKTDPEYVVVFDDAALSAAKAAKTNLQYFLRGDTASTFSASSDYRDITFRKPTDPAAMISTKVLFPDGASPTVSYVQTSYTHKVTFDWGTTTSVRMIAVHRIATGTSDVMPTVSLLTSDSSTYAVQIADSSYPVVVALPANGADAQSRSFTATASGTGSIIVTGLTGGTYDVYRNGGRLLDDVTVASNDGTIAVHNTTVAGEWLVTAVPPPELNIDKTNLSFTSEGNVPAPQTFTAYCVGGSCTISATESVPWLDVKPASGNNSVEFTVSCNPLGLAPGIYSTDITVSAPGTNGSPKTVHVTLSVTEQLRGGATVKSFRLRGQVKVK